MANGTGLTPDEGDAWLAFVVSAMQVTTRLDRALQADHDLSLDDYGILAVLSRSPDGAVRFSDIAHTLRMPKANVTYRFQRMARRGLVERRSCASDGRGAFVVLTRDGAAVFAAAQTPHLERVRHMFVDPIEPDALPVLARQLGHVLTALDRDDA